MKRFLILMASYVYGVFPLNSVKAVSNAELQDN